MELETLLYKHFQYDHFRPGQEEVIQSVLSGQHTLAMLPTGTGKSLCYQLPGYLLEGHIVIVSPLLSLMQDQVEQMKMNGEKRVIALNSFLTYQEKKTAISNITKYKFILISPEMLGMDQVIAVIQKLNVSLFVIDEAHCISQWGYDFRPDYLKLGFIRQKLNNPVTLALTATATEEVRQDIMESLGIACWKEFVYSADRKNIAITIENLEDYQKKLARLLELVRHLQGPGIIYFSSKRLAEQTAAILHDEGITGVMPYHGGMDQEQRILIQQQFIYGQLDVICATSAFGMGINKENIRYIIHFHMPQQMESYLQEIGRAGRDGERSIAILLYSPGDEVLASQLAEGELPTREQIEYLFHYLTEIDPFQFHSSGTDEWRKLAGFTDIQWRIISDYLIESEINRNELNFVKQKLINFIEERKRLKREKLAWMTNWVHFKGCRRNPILSYFSEDISRKERIINCCDHCGVENRMFLRKALNPLNGNKSFDWKNYLSGILLK